MSKKARLTHNEVANLIQAEIACRVGTGNSARGGTAEKILEKYNERISKGKSKARVISKSTIEHKLADLRRDREIPPAAANLPTEERPLDSETPWSLDQPWSLASLAYLAKQNMPLPPEAMPAVLRVWNWRVSCDESFSIREAIWVSRLYTIFDPVKEQQTLMDWTSRLALRERVCQLLSQDFTTSDFDTRLTEPDYRKIIGDARTGRTQSVQLKPTSRDILEKAKRTPSTWPAGVKEEFTDLDIIKTKKEANHER